MRLSVEQVMNTPRSMKIKDHGILCSLHALELAALF